MPVGVGYNPHYSGDVHAVQTARYDTAAPRRGTDHKTPANPTTTITTYNVTKDPAPRTSNTARRRSSTVDSSAVKPIIVTTNHASQPHRSSTTHASTSSSNRNVSPSRDPYRSSDETYYAQPASSLPSRGQNRHSHGYSQSATLSNDEFYRLRERVGDDRLRPPTHTTTDYYRYSLPHAGYAVPPHELSTAVIDYENEGYEYTKPSDLARYDLDHDRQPRSRRRESIDQERDRNYYQRPTVNVESNDPGRYDGRNRRPPPTSSALDRYNRTATGGIYDRPTVTMPALPAVPPPPPIDPLRRIEGPRDTPARDTSIRETPARDTSIERRSARPRPVSLYQETPARTTHHDDVYRSKDDERVHRRRDRDDDYRDDDVASRGFGIRTNSLNVEQSDRPARSVDRRDYDDRRARREVTEREPRRRSDESIDYTRAQESRKPADDTISRVDSSRDSKDGISRKNSLGGRARDKVAAGLGIAAAAMGLAPAVASKETSKDDDRKGSPRRRDTEEDREAGSSRPPPPADRYKPREKEYVSERKPSVRDEDVIVEQRREPRRERAESSSATRDRELERERVRERAHERERERERDEREAEKAREQREREKERERERDRERDRERELELREREKERERERSRREPEPKVNGSAVVDARDNSPNSDATAAPSRRRPHLSSAFDPTDTKDLMSLKAELAAKGDQEKPRDKPSRDHTPEKQTVASASPERQPAESREESRGREIVPAQKEEKQVRVVSPPRDKNDEKPIKGILKQPRVKFPEDENPIREGVAPHKDDKTKKGVPAGARWTKINRKLINPAALEIGKERFEVRDDFVIVLRVLSKEEIQAYATATAQIREKKRKEYEQEAKGERNPDQDRDRSDEEKKTRRHRRDRDDDYEYRRDRDQNDDRDKDRERHRRHRRDEDSDDEGRKRDRRAIEFDDGSTSRHEPRSHRSHRDRDYDSTVNSDEKR